MLRKITGLKKAVGEYNRANAGGFYSSRYGYLMLDRSTGEVWTDEFCDYGHGTYKNYHSSDIINLSREILGHGITVSMKSVRQFAEQLMN